MNGVGMMAPGDHAGFSFMNGGSLMAVAELLALDVPGQGFKEVGQLAVDEHKHREDQKDFEDVLVAHGLNGLSQRRFVQPNFGGGSLFRRRFFKN